MDYRILRIPTIIHLLFSLTLPVGGRRRRRRRGRGGGGKGGEEEDAIQPRASARRARPRGATRGGVGARARLSTYAIRFTLSLDAKDAPTRPANRPTHARRESDDGDERASEPGSRRSRARAAWQKSSRRSLETDETPRGRAPAPACKSSRTRRKRR